MPRHEDSIIINKPAETVFEYVSTPAKWLEFHEAVVKMEPIIEHSFKPGDPGFFETVLVGKFENKILYKAIENDPPHVFTVKGTTDSFGGGVTECTYACKKIDDTTTLFTRIFTYSYSALLMKFVSGVLMNRKIRSGGRRALATIKRILEEKS